MTDPPSIDTTRVYIAPTGTPLPASLEDLEQGGQWLSSGQPINEAARLAYAAEYLGLVGDARAHLELTYQPPQPYHPNRATRRAAARTARQGHR